MSGKSNIKSAGYYLYFYLLYNGGENRTWKWVQKKNPKKYPSTFYFYSCRLHTKHFAITVLDFL